MNSKIRRLFTTQQIIALGAVLILGLLLGLWMNTAETIQPKPQDHNHSEVQESIWTCSMHPQIRQPKPGLCPICGMDLIPANQGDVDSGDWELKLSPNAMKLASVETAAAKRQYIAHEVSLVGKVQLNERTVTIISAWISGRVDRLFVDFTGIQVRQGDHMVSLYSPDLLSGQQELLEAKRSFQNGSSGIKKSAKRRWDAAKKKLALWGFSQDQIKAIEQKNEVVDHLTINAPSSGIVLEKHVLEGAYVETGAPFYTIADLSQVWVKLDAYESNLHWMRFGQEVSFRTEAYPGRMFQGNVVFIDPVIDPQTRTAKVRVNVDNSDLLLKPDMFVRASVHVKVGGSGRPLEPSLAGKYVCPMHPEEVDESAGRCGICGMPLVTAESLGYGDKREGPQEAPLLIPDTAPLITGNRAVVYVSKGEGRFEGREVVLGPKAGDFYVVLEGLSENEHVVTKGNFKIDSELQIQAKHSMMYHPQSSGGNDSGRFNERFAAEPDFRDRLRQVFGDYLDLQVALANDSAVAAKDAANRLSESIGKFSGGGLDPKALVFWNREKRIIQKGAKEIGSNVNIKTQRTAFSSVSDSLYLIGSTFGVPIDVNRFFCPMAFDNQGAHWLQSDSDTRNPYFGKSMLRCGSLVEQIDPKHVSGEDHE